MSSLDGVSVGDEVIVRLSLGDAIVGYRRGRIGKLWDGEWPDDGMYFAWIAFYGPSMGAWYEREAVSPYHDDPAAWRFG